MHIISTKALSLSTLKTLAFEGSKIELSDEVIQKIQECRDYLDQKMSNYTILFMALTLGLDRCVMCEFTLKTLQNYKKT